MAQPYSLSQTPRATRATRDSPVSLCRDSQWLDLVLIIPRSALHANSRRQRASSHVTCVVLQTARANCGIPKITTLLRVFTTSRRERSILLETAESRKDVEETTITTGECFHDGDRPVRRCWLLGGRVSDDAEIWR